MMRNHKACLPGANQLLMEVVAKKQSTGGKECSVPPCGILLAIGTVRKLTGTSNDQFNSPTYDIKRL
jgi:hypothetical protein